MVDRGGAVGRGADVGERDEATSLCYSVRGLTRRHSTVLANGAIDLEVSAGEVFGLLGPNGAGKTTLVRQLVGLLPPDAGRVSLFGVDLRAHPGYAARTVAYLPQ